jgi:hypothetical protein
MLHQTTEDPQCEQAPAWPISDFFEVLKKNFKELIFLSYSATNVEGCICSLWG